MNSQALQENGNSASPRARVLFVDDEPLVLEGISRSLRHCHDFIPEVAHNAEQAIHKLKHEGPFAIVVSDMRMPGMDGVKFLAKASVISPDSVRVMLTGCSDQETAARAVNDGAIFRFLRKPAAAHKLLSVLRESSAQYQANLHQKELLLTTTEALEQLDVGTLTALARAIDAKSTWTSGHSERVTTLALQIGKAMGLSSAELRILHRGGLLHDIGKIGTPNPILDKPGSLDREELRIMREHVKTGVRILEPVPCFRELLPIVGQHHEWFDGSGYPLGLRGENISLLARILAVADCYDALASDRPYRKGLASGEVIKILQQRSGTQFDPKVMQVFLHRRATLIETPPIAHSSPRKSGG